MALSSANAQTLAQTLFTSLSSQVSGLKSGSLTSTITVTDNGLNRTATATFSASSLTSFGGIIGQTTLTIGGKSTASASLPPNIDFYLLLDNSPSMAIAATTSGIDDHGLQHQLARTAAPSVAMNTILQPMVSAIPAEDNYQLARNLGVTLRIDLVAHRRAKSDDPGAEHRDDDQCDLSHGDLHIRLCVQQPPVADVESHDRQTAASNIQLLEVYQQNWLTRRRCRTTTTVGANDTDTDFSAAMNSINSIMPNPGGGTQAKGDSPQEVLFLVTDGVEDAMVSGNRVQALMDTSWCTTVKNRGIRIAVLYTHYLPLPTNSWYNT